MFWTSNSSGFGWQIDKLKRITATEEGKKKHPTQTNGSFFLILAVQCSSEHGGKTFHLRDA